MPNGLFVRFPKFLAALLIALAAVLSGCGTASTLPAPVLLAEMSLTPTTTAPITRAPRTTPTPSRTRIRPTPSPTRIPVTAVSAPTRDAPLPPWFTLGLPQFHTATLLPTRTPLASETPTLTDTPRATLRPTASRTPSITPTFVPNRPVTLTPLPGTPPPAVCAYPWSFANAPANCPANEATNQAAAFQRFERGIMIRLDTDHSILILFDSPEAPRWLLVPDLYREGTPQTGPLLISPEGTFQPVRSFGLVWRSNVQVRERLGWALADEVGYTTSVQIDAVTGSRYILGPDQEIYGLPRDQAAWFILE